LNNVKLSSLDTEEKLAGKDRKWA